MMIISFAWTTPAVRALRKTRTRRDWAPDYAAKFKAGAVCQGYDKGPRIGGELVNLIRLTRDPWPECTGLMTEVDFEAEGFAYMEEQGMVMRGHTPREFFEAWKTAMEVLYVVEFSYVWDMAYQEGCGYKESHFNCIARGIKTAERPRLPRPLGQLCWDCTLPCARVVQRPCKEGVKCQVLHTP